MPIQLGDPVPPVILTGPEGERTRLDALVSGPAILIFLRHLA